ncbi:hypothetical protein [Weissella halotolerans]|uniref:Uncharacterized protein n=1 Tax=Weissella halotolerans DSM 20190 TaxID=1123500 RepID=A0A0R2G4J6_9LACO|nr:hypothetical protein [Weissella halotolerans]KRN32391.1 hypothetical protein IV68_GL000742 [Weissella halotolerans DSM 20190]
MGYLEVVAKETNPRIALSQKYFNVIVRQFFGESFEPILKEDEQTQTVEQSVMGLFRPYVGLYRSELCRQFKVSIPEKNPKAVNSTLARKMLRLNTDIQNSAEFQKANIAVKVLTVKSDNVGSVNTHHQRTKGSLKIQNYFDFGKILNETWEESDLRTYLFDTKFLLVLFEDTGDDQIFKGAKFWQVPLEDLDGPIKYVWERTRHILREGVTLSYIPYNNANGYRILNNLPAASDHNVLHVRPDAKKSSYKVGDVNSLPLPAPVKWKNRPKHLINELSNNWMTKQAFWLNPDYMYQQVADLM